MFGKRRKSNIKKHASSIFIKSFTVLNKITKMSVDFRSTLLRTPKLFNLLCLMFQKESYSTYIKSYLNLIVLLSENEEEMCREILGKPFFGEILLKLLKSNNCLEIYEILICLERLFIYESSPFIIIIHSEQFIKPWKRQIKTILGSEYVNNGMITFLAKLLPLLKKI